MAHLLDIGEVGEAALVHRVAAHGAARAADGHGQPLTDALVVEAVVALQGRPTSPSDIQHVVADAAVGG